MQRSIPLLILPVAVPAAYLIYLSWKITSRTTITTGRADIREPTRRSSHPEPVTPSRPISLPADIVANVDAQWVVTYERVVSQPVAVSAIAVASNNNNNIQSDKVESPHTSLLQVYTRATHLAFRRTPQARLMRAAMQDPAAKRTFDADWIRALSFQSGDVVNGGYKVVYAGPGPGSGPDPGSDRSVSGRVELMIEAPASYRGPPPPKGLILTEVQYASGQDNEEEPTVVFVNETWMWRRRDEKPTLIESGLGALFHGLMAGWLVMRGIEGVTVGI